MSLAVIVEHTRRKKAAIMYIYRLFYRCLHENAA